MKIKTKKASLIFTFLFVILIPYSAIFQEFDLVNSIIPGWHTTLNSFNLITNMIKLIFLLIILILYWKLSNFQKEMKIKFFILHLILTIPAIFISKFPLTNFLSINYRNFDQMLNEVEKLNKIVILINMLFVIGQILFAKILLQKLENQNYRILISVNKHFNKLRY